MNNRQRRQTGNEKVSTAFHTFIPCHSTQARIISHRYKVWHPLNAHLALPLTDTHVDDACRISAFLRPPCHVLTQTPVFHLSPSALHHHHHCEHRPRRFHLTWTLSTRRIAREAALCTCLHPLITTVTAWKSPHQYSNFGVLSRVRLPNLRAFNCVSLILPAPRSRLWPSPAHLAQGRITTVLSQLSRNHRPPHSHHQPLRKSDSLSVARRASGLRRAPALHPKARAAYWLIRVITATRRPSWLGVRLARRN